MQDDAIQPRLRFREDDCVDLLAAQPERFYDPNRSPYITVPFEGFQIADLGIGNKKPRY